MQMWQGPVPVQMWQGPVPAQMWAARSPTDASVGVLVHPSIGWVCTSRSDRSTVMRLLVLRTISRARPLDPATCSLPHQNQQRWSFYIAGTTYPTSAPGPRHICTGTAPGPAACVSARRAAHRRAGERACKATDRRRWPDPNAARGAQPAEKPVCSRRALDRRSARSLICPRNPAPARQALGVGLHAPSVRSRPLDGDRRQRRRRRARVQHGAGARGFGARDGVDVRGQRRRRRPVAAQPERPPSPGADVVGVSPSPGADVARVSPVPVQMWAG